MASAQKPAVWPHFELELSGLWGLLSSVPIESSKGKARATLPRSSDLRAVPQPVLEPRQGRLANGRFAPGHKSARSRGWRRALVQLAGPHVADQEVVKLAYESGALFRARMGELPHQGPSVSALVAEGSRSTVLSTHLAARALAVGLETDKGRQLLELSLRLGQRAERTVVTALDVSTRLAEAEKRARGSDMSWLFAPPAPGADQPVGAGTTSEDSGDENATTRQPEAATHEGD